MKRLLWMPDTKVDYKLIKKIEYNHGWSVGYLHLKDVNPKLYLSIYDINKESFNVDDPDVTVEQIIKAGEPFDIIVLPTHQYYTFLVAKMFNNKELFCYIKLRNYKADIAELPVNLRYRYLLTVKNELSAD